VSLTLTGGGHSAGKRQAVALGTDPIGPGAWIWFSDPRALYYAGTHRRLYTGWITKTGDVYAAHYDLDTGQIMRTMLAQALQVDDHAAPALMIRPDGRVMAFYCSHNDTAGHKLAISTEAEDCGSFSSPELIDGPIAQNGSSYAHPIYLSGEDKMYVFFRGGNSRDWYITSSDHGATWAAPVTLIDTGSNRPYHKVCSNGVDTIHIAFNQEHPGGATSTDLYHVYINAGNIYKSDGTPIRALGSGAIAHTDATKVYDHATGGRSWVWDVALDGTGKPYITHALFPNGDAADWADHRYHYAAWSGSAWTSRQIVTDGPAFEGSGSEPQYSGGVSLNHNDVTTVYTSRKIVNQWEIEKHVTSDVGQTWTTTAITTNTTSGSAHRNARPVSVRGNPPADCPKVLWFQGDYAHFTSFDTQILYA
jgi:hypothetical protein